MLLVAGGLGCTFEVGSSPAGPPEVVETDTEAASESTAVTSSQASSSGAFVSTSTTETTGSEPTTSGEAEDTQEDEAFAQELLITKSDSYDLPQVPLLVTLTPENSRWDAIAPDFSNLRFMGSAGGDAIELPFEVGGTEDEWAQLWVLVPEVSGEADRFRVEYGVGISPSPWLPEDVWSAYEAVWHLGEDPADPRPQFHDSSGHGRHISNEMNDSIPSDEMVPGIVGRAPRFNEDRELQISNSEWPDSNIGDRFTVEAWVQYEETPPNSFRWIVRKTDTYELIGSRNQPEPLIRPAWSVHDGSSFRYTEAAGESWSQGPGVWNYAAATFERNMKAGQVRTALYLDGTVAATEDSPNFQPAQTQADFRIGSQLTAIVDEVRVSFEVRPPEWFELQNRSMRGELLEFGDPMPLE